MCSANLGKLDPLGSALAKSQVKLADKISPGDAIFRKMGFVGGKDPMREFFGTYSGTKTKTQRLAARAGQKQATAERDAQYRRSVTNTPSGHVLSIAAKRARG